VFVVFHGFYLAHDLLFRTYNIHALTNQSVHQKLV